MSELSSKQMLQQIAFNRLNQDGTEVATTKMILTDIASQSATNLANANRDSSLSMVQTLTALQELGYDKDSDVVKDLVAADKQIRKVLTDIGSAIPRLL